MIKYELDKMADAIRQLSVASIHKAQSGHPGMPLGMADVATVLFSKFLNFDANAPGWVDRDRFILSAGHGSMLLYSILYLTGYKDIGLEDIKQFRQYKAKTTGHPEYGRISGVENTSGPLGQGFATAVGCAISERVMNAQFGDDIINHQTYVIAGDGCLMEGVSHEAASIAGHLSLKNLVLFFDNNGISIDGPTSITVSDDTLKRFESYGWDTIEINGHSFSEIERAIVYAHKSERPCLISCVTTIGKGIPSLEGTENAHSVVFDNELLQKVRTAFSWDKDLFSIDQGILEQWQSTSKSEMRKIWEQNLEDSQQKEKLYAFIKAKAPEAIFKKIKTNISLDKKNEATRKSSEYIINHISNDLPFFIGGSADLTKSNGTKSSTANIIAHDNFNGQYIYYGVREHAMAAIMNGLALSGMTPYAGSFFVFTDYCKASIRLSAIMKLKVIYVMTHDSIGVGEDGPTHQPVEHLASMRAMPNIYTFRPADAIETLECWETALSQNNTPSMLVLSRQSTPLLRSEAQCLNKSSKGAYIISEYNNSQHNLDITIFATGTEVNIALQAKKIMEMQNNSIGVRIISMPCWEKFDEQDQDYRDSLLNNKSIKIAVEAGADLGWHKYIGKDGIFIGLNHFGESAPSAQVYEHFNITPEFIARSGIDNLKK